jgi:hypothetical protein
MQRRSRIRPLVVLTAIGLALAPGAGFAQFIAPPPRVTPTPTVTPQLPSTPTNLPSFQTPNFTMPNVNVNGNAIIPTDVLNWGANLPGGFTAEGGHSERVITEITDLEQFLKENGWMSGAVTEVDPDILADDGITIDTGFEDDLEKLIPISWNESGGEKAFMLCSEQPSIPHVIVRLSQNSNELMVFTKRNQFSSAERFGAEDALLSGFPGTVVSGKKQNLVLHKGQLVVDTGNTALKIATKAGGVKIEPNTTAIIEYQPTRSFSVIALASKSSTPVKARLAITADRVTELANQERLSIDLSKDGPAALESVDQSKVDVNNYVRTLPGKTIGSASKLIARMEKRVKLAAADKSKSSEESALMTTEPVHLVGLDGSRVVASEGGSIALLEGRVFLHSQAPQIVRTKLGDAYLQGDSVNSLEVSNGQTRLLCCSEPKSSIFVANKHGIPMNWGMETVVTNHAPTWNDAVPNDGIGRRQFEMHKLNDLHCVMSDFSIHALMLKGRHLKSIRVPACSTHERLRDKLLKTAAALQVVTAKKGRYYLQSELLQASQPQQKPTAVGASGSPK